MKNVNTATSPSIDYRDAKHAVGIRIVAPFEGMFAAIEPLMKELRQWVSQQKITNQGPFFLRYHVIDMKGQMDVEVGCMVPEPIDGNGHIRPSILPAGYYANLIYSGGGYQGNKMLIDWAKTNGIPWDRWDDANGDGFRCRYEAYLTDPRIEPRKTKWKIELAIKVKDEYMQNNPA